jgi:hypothetical protein
LGEIRGQMWEIRGQVWKIRGNVGEIGEFREESFEDRNPGEVWWTDRN